MPQAEFAFVKSVCTGMISIGILRISTIFVSTSKECTFHQKLGFIMSNIWFETSFPNGFGKNVTLQRCEKGILNKQVSNELASQMVFISQWSNIQKGYSKTRDYSENSDF